MSNDPIIEKIVVARIGLLLRHPFFGNLATRLKVVDGSDWLLTAATDGRHIFFNREFFSDLTPKEIEFVIAHEIWHNIFEHMLRVESRDRKLWNVAADYCVNGHLVRDKIGTVPSKVKIFHDTKHYGKSAEQVYDELYDQYDQDQLDQLGQLLDEHLDWEGDGDGDGQNGNGNQNGRPRYTKEELRQIRDELKEAMMQAAQAAGAGNTPGEVARMIKELTEPKMNWRQMLRQQIQSCIRNDFTWTRPSRKGWHVGAVLPGSNFQETIDICVAIDMSGSISNAQANDFLSEIKGIMDQFQDYKIKVMCFDTRVYNEQDFDSQCGESIDEYQVMGGGGTDFMCVWDYLKEHNIVPKKMIMFTDMYPCGSWGDPDYTDTIFVGHGTTSIVAPFGTTVYYDEA